MPRWTPEDAPRVDRAVAVVTGASSGLGERTAEALAARGAHVVLATRDAARTAAAMDRIRAVVPGACLTHEPLDLADLASVSAAAARLTAAHPRIDLLVANAGIMAVPEARSAQGFESQLAVNHLGHQALTALLLPAIASAAGRVVVVSSSVHRAGRIDPQDLDGSNGRYRPWAAYARSKLANLLFVAELLRRIAAAGSPVLALAAHPGFAATNLQEAGPRLRGGLSARVVAPLTGGVTRLVAQSAAKGALPQLYAALSPDVEPGAYYGPDGPGEMRGWPTRVTPSATARDPDLARAVWDATERATGVLSGLPD
jgi:NAD(P)-dependent dehydrogenase (short-subunit alcohol dehydrogenase family)